MGHDPWVDAVRAARGDASRLFVVLDELPLDGLQRAGNTLLPHVAADGAAPVVARLVIRLRDRGWEGDAELAAALAQDEARELRALPVDLEDLGEALDESEASAGFVDLETGQVWPGALFEVDAGPEDADLDDASRWLLVRGSGPGASRRDMRDFAITVDRPALRERLLEAVKGRGGHRRFRDTLAGHGEEFTRWHRFRDDRLLGRARAWLADAGYRPIDG
jgi:hypothetical protein